jgi:predicted TIM-barrel fold metal-dependent hydrolase
VIVDTHLHPLSPDLTAYPRQATSRFQGVNAAADAVAQLKHAGVDRALAVQFQGVYGYDNSYIADSVSAYPETFAGVGCVDPLAPDAADQLASWTKRGIRGLRLFAPRERPDLARWPDEPAVYPLYEAAIALGVPVCLSHGAAFLAATGTLAQRFPQLILVLDHMSSVPMDASAVETQALLALAREPNVHVKFSTQNFAAVSDRAEVPRFIRDLAGAYGAARLMWGSNYPVSKGSEAEPYRDLFEQGLAAVSLFDDGAAEQILGGTAARVFRLGDFVSPGQLSGQ